jgi:hypothetical protein
MASDPLIGMADPTYVTVEWLSTSFAYMAYGMVVCLYVTCFGALTADFANKKNYPPRKKWSLISYITLMLLLSTAALIESTVTAVGNTLHIDDKAHSSGLLSLYILPVTIWAADAFMVNPSSPLSNISPNCTFGRCGVVSPCIKGFQELFARYYLVLFFFY